MLDLHPILLNLVFLAWGIVSVMLILHYLRQPTPVAYIISGLLIGPHVLGFVTDRPLLELLGEMGLILLLFFVGTEVSLSRFAKNWRIVLVGTVAQVVLSVCIMLVVGSLAEWPLARTILLAFVVSLSSTAVVIKFLEERNLLASKLGIEVTGILIMQDLLLVPMLLVVNALGGQADATTIPLQVIGLVLFSGLTFFVLRTFGTRTPRWMLLFKEDRELQLFVALLVCFGLALLAETLHLSYGLGAFIAGLLLAHVGGVSWVRRQLHPFHTFFMALFFVSVGMLIDLEFLQENLALILTMLVVVLVMNTGITAVVFRMLGESWRYSIFAGSLLAQVGELSFLLAAAGLSAGAITRDGYQTAVLVISLSLLVSPLWVTLVGRPLRALSNSSQTT